MSMTLDELLAQWDSDEGKPFKGKLIDIDAYRRDPGNPGCMCAQGQVLHFMGGYMKYELTKLEIEEADKETAKLLGISTVHSVLLRIINDNVDGAPSVVITHPERIIGDHVQLVLAFWRHLDLMPKNQLNRHMFVWNKKASVESGNVRCYINDNTSDSLRHAAWSVGGDIAGLATLEIVGEKVLRENKQPFFFLPLFGFDTPEDINKEN